MSKRTKLPSKSARVRNARLTSPTGPTSVAHSSAASERPITDIDGHTGEQARRAHQIARLTDGLTDTTTLIGLAMGHARAGRFHPGCVPRAILSELGRQGLAGDENALRVLGYIHSRGLQQIQGSDGRIHLKTKAEREIGGAL